MRARLTAMPPLWHPSAYASWARQPEEQPADDGNSDGYKHHLQIDCNCPDPRQTGWVSGDQRLYPDTREQHSESTAGDREHHALGQHLAEEPAAAGTERRQHCEFALTAFGARQKQVRNISAGDEQHEPDGRL